MIKIFIVDDHAVMAEGLQNLLEQEPGFVVNGFALNAAGCLKFFETGSADVILMDINLPDMSGVELCYLVKKKYPAVQVLALSTLNEGTYIKKMMESGASGYLLKNAGRLEITEAIQQVAKGKEYLGADALQALRRHSELQEDVPTLTKREKEILGHIVHGLTSGEIAEKLFISSDTVESHRKHLHTKLNVHNTAQLVKYAIEHELV